MARILVVEDEKPINILIKKNLVLIFGFPPSVKLPLRILIERML